MAVTKKIYGTMPDGQEIYEYTLKRGNAVSVSFINYGGIITGISVKDKDGAERDVVLGRASLEEYLHNDGYIGAVIGRYANRISGGLMSIGGDRFRLAQNEGNNCLHGGKKGFDQKVWTVESVGENYVDLSLISPDGDEGFPGTMKVTMRYEMTEENTFGITYRAVSDKDTVCTLTNHSYFNLSGHESGNVYDQELQIFGDFYMPIDDESIPTGEILKVSGTPFDFTEPKPIGRDINDPCAQVQKVGGFDHNYAIRGNGFRIAAKAYSKESGICMSVTTDQSGMQLYTANAIPAGVKKDKREYGKHDAFCLETQAFPNSVNMSQFPSPILRANEEYHTVTRYSFTLEER